VSDPSPSPSPAPSPAAPPTRRRPRAAFRVLAALAPVVVVFAAGEAFVRWRYDIVAPRPFILAAEGKYKDKGIYEVAPAPLLWRHVPDYRGFYYQQTERLPVSTNELGLRDPPLTPERKGARRRVLFIGDSVTFGRGVADGEPFPTLLEARWNARLGGGVATFNAGVAGYDTVQEAASLKEVGPALAPHLVLLGWYRNDVAVPSVEGVAPTIIDGQFVPEGGEEEYRRWRARYVDNTATPLDWSALIRLLRMEWKNWKTTSGLDDRAADATPVNEVGGMQRSQRALADIQAWCQSHGARLGVILFPAREEVEAEVLMEHPQYQRQMTAFCEERHIPCLDLFDRWRAWAAAHRGRTLYLPRDRCHPNAPGHAQVAEWVEGFFTDELKAASEP
jgi:lysophospholipase L1-like esterase